MGAARRGRTTPRAGPRLLRPAHPSVDMARRSAGTGARTPTASPPGARPADPCRSGPAPARHPSRPSAARALPTDAGSVGLDVAPPPGSRLLVGMGRSRRPRVIPHAVGTQEPCAGTGTRLTRNLYRIIVEPISANSSNPSEGSGPQRFGRSAPHQIAADATQMTHATCVPMSARRDLSALAPATTMSIGKYAGNTARQAPAEVATPFPPRKRLHTGKMCPAMAAVAAA